MFVKVLMPTAVRMNFIQCLEIKSVSNFSLSVSTSLKFGLEFNVLAVCAIHQLGDQRFATLTLMFHYC
jgi:hypothetical protein